MLDYDIKLETPLITPGGEDLWFHPRVAAIPTDCAGRPPAVVMTLSKHLKTSDHYSGLYAMRSDDLGRTWAGPEAVPELAWVNEGDVHIAVADVTPGYHAPTGKVLAIGAQVRYGRTGAQLEDVKRAHQTAYAVYDPENRRWTKWKRLEMPPDDKFDFARNACAQWLVQPDGTLLLPLYFGTSAGLPTSVTVAQCAFDGTDLRYLRHDTELKLNEVRGLVEPSLIRFDGRYYLTIRNDNRGYVTVGEDGLNSAPIKPWTFDDGSELGSYNTQQHWLAHSEGLFLVYTRRGANNDHIVRHRAPLFMARVAPDRLCVLRSTERVLIPARLGELGNFGAAPITESESWVTVSEGVWDSKYKYHPEAESRTFVARVSWSKPNLNY
jgi:hypothetical protein